MKKRLTKEQMDQIANQFVLSTVLCIIGAMVWFLVLRGILRYTLVVDTIIKSRILAAVLLALAVGFAIRAKKLKKPYSAIISAASITLLLCILTVIIYRTNTLYAIYIGFIYFALAFIAQLCYYTLKQKGKI